MATPSPSSLLYGVILVLFFFVQAITQPFLANESFLSTLYFNTSRALNCDPSQSAPGFITTIFLANGPFAFGCLSYQKNPTYFLSVAISSANFPNVPIWVANRYRPVKDNATLSADSRSSIVLTDVDGSVIWDSNTSNVAGMRLAADGNLIMFDNRGLTVWQSFDEPIDLLVPNQSLKTNQMLVSGFSSYLIDSPTGNFTAQMNPGGLILYELSSSIPLPYYAIQYPFFPSTVNDILTSPCNHTQLQLNYYNFTLVQVPPSPSCKPPSVNNSPLAVSFDSQVAFVRLDPDGNIRGYHRDYKPSFDLFKSSTRGLCGIPNVCGPYGVCNVSSIPPCQCPGGNQSLALFSQLEGIKQYLLSSTTCAPKVPMNCKQSGGSSQQDGQNEGFVDMEKVDYFANDYIAPTMLSQTFELCKAACAANCSCRAAFYRARSHQCFLQDDVLSMIQVSTSDYKASIKYEKGVSLDATRRRSEMKLIIGISIASLVSIIFLAMWHCQKGQPTGPHTILLKDEHELLASLPGQPKRFNFKDLRAATSDFSHKLGVGGFGSVYRGVFPDGSSVAVKQLENATKTAQGLKEFRNEVIALSNINHQNLVHLRGFCADGPHRLLVYEFMPNGSLDTWLFRKGSDSPGQPLDWKTRLSIAEHTARGLFFLHEQCRNRIVHLDIKPQNILLDGQFVAKLSDFGLSRLINEDETSAVTRMRGTPGYMAPECLILTDATEKSDVYSFGMVLLEILSGRKNVDVSRLVLCGDGAGWYFPAMAAKKFQEGHMEDILDKTLLGRLDMAQATRVIQIAFWCIQDEPSLRPTMGNVLLMIEGYAPVPPPPLSFHFGMLFHRTNTITIRHANSGITPSSSSQNADVDALTKPAVQAEPNLDKHHQPAQELEQEQQPTPQD